MINDAMQPANSPTGALFNLLTFIVGFCFSLAKVPATELAQITLTGSAEVIWYGILGGIASLLAKNVGDFLLSRIKFLKAGK